MKIETNLFFWLAPFFLVVTAVYALMSDFEPVGSVCLLLLVGLSGMIAAYLRVTARQMDARPEDDPHGEIEQGAGDQGIFAPWSWWPLVLAGALALVFLGLAAGTWISFIGGPLVLIAIVGWNYEFYRKNFAR